MNRKIRSGNGAPRPHRNLGVAHGLIGVRKGPSTRGANATWEEGVKHLGNKQKRRKVAAARRKSATCTARSDGYFRPHPFAWRVEKPAMPSLRFRCSASEMLSLFGMVRYFIDTQVPSNPGIASKRASWEAMCRLLDILLSAKRSMDDPARAGAAARSAAASHLRLHVAAYNTDLVKPKHHWALDQASQLGKDGVVLDQFVIERLHLRVKSIATPIMNTVRFERSVLSGLINSQFEAASGDAAASSSGLWAR